MSKWNERVEKMRQREQERKEKETTEFLNRVNILKNDVDSVTIPSVSIMKEYEDKYINYYISKYPNCLQFSITMRRKNYPFDIYYSKEFFKNEIPQKYIKDFEELEQYFNN